MQQYRPIIGITPSVVSEETGAFGTRASYAMRDTYTKAVETAGGIPVVLPPTMPEAAAAVVARIDALLLSGGGDIRPERYGDTGPQHPKTYGISDDRDAWEDALLAAAFAVDLPVLAICRGVQVLNVYQGGTLWQDIPDQMPGADGHDQPKDADGHAIPHATAHPVAATGLLAEVYGTDEVGHELVPSSGRQGCGAGSRRHRHDARWPGGIRRAAGQALRTRHAVAPGSDVRGTPRTPRPLPRPRRCRNRTAHRVCSGLRKSNRQGAKARRNAKRHKDDFFDPLRAFAPSRFNPSPFR